MAIITVINNANRGKGSLREAIKKAKSGDTIKFDPSLAEQNITLKTQIGITKSLTIDGGDATGLTISGGKQTRLFWFGKENESLTVQNLTLADSYHKAGVGGAIWAAKNSTIEIENANFVDHVSQGAALHAQRGSNITVTNSTFDNNDGTNLSNKPYSTGAISLFGFGSLTIDNSIFTNNKGYGGGALHVTISDLIVKNSLFTGNDSTAGANKSFVDVPGGGGAIYLDGASVPNDPRFTERIEEAQTEGGVFEVVNSRFENNRAAGEGGAILAYGYHQDRIVIQDSEITNNEVIENRDNLAQGGGLRLSGFIEIDNTRIANNQSAKIGGGLYLQGEVPVIISNSDFTGNQAVDGGAIYDGLWNSSIKIDNTLFDSNLATNEGGVFHSRNDGSVSFQNSSFSNNSSDDLDKIASENDVADIVYGSDSHNAIAGTDSNSYLVGLNGHDTIEGAEGNDYLYGGANDDNLFGGIGKDTLIGGHGNNLLVGGYGDDIFIGGNGRDLIEGGNGRDSYIIGDENKVYYNDRPWYDRAILLDFQPQDDTIQLHGQASDYNVRAINSEGISGTGIFHNNSLIALVSDVKPSNFSLNAEYINYADATDNGSSNNV